MSQSIGESIYAEIDKMLYDSQHSKSNNKINVDRKGSIMKLDNVNNNIGSVVPKPSRESCEFEHLASLILLEDSHSRNLNSINDYSQSEKTTFQVPNQIEHIIYKENLENQPEISILRK